MKFALSCLTVVAVTLGRLSTPAQAQIVPDTSLPVNSVVAPNGNIFTLEGGTAAGDNLFHSFQEFSVPTGTEAFFNNAPNIENIFTRVTGANLSNIDGILRANGGANLFVLNPHGIVFGLNARLELGGSFFGTTAQSIRFADGAEFSATHPTIAPLLTVSVPVGLQFAGNSGAIAVNGSGHRLRDAFARPIDRSQNPVGLQIKAGNTFSLTGNGVTFVGGVISTAGGGHLEIGSLSDGSVALTPSETGWVGDYANVAQFQDIHLAQQSLLDASGSRGSIQIQGRNISLSEGSAALLQNLGDEGSGGIAVKATGLLKFTGNPSVAVRGSALEIENVRTSPVGDMVVSAGNLSLYDGGIINAQTFTQTSGPNIRVNVTGTTELNGFAPVYGGTISTIATTVIGASGNAGNITLKTGSLRAVNSGTVSSVTGGSGRTGTIRVQARDLIELAGNNPFTLSSSGIFTTSINAGDANSIIIDTSRLVIRESGVVGSVALAAGSAGSATVNASESIDIEGQAAGALLPSRIFSAAQKIDSATQVALGLPPVSTGNSGSLTINTPFLRLANRASVTVQNDGPGRAGNLEINARTISLEDRGSITAATASGNGGNIQLNVQDNLSLRTSSLISATAAGTGDGGNIEIDTPVLVALENSDTIANALQGRGGNIDIKTQGIFGLESRPQLTPKSDISASSQLGVDGVVTITNPAVEPSSSLVSLSQEVVDPGEQVVAGCQWTGESEFVATGRGGVPASPSRPIFSHRTWSDVRDLSAFRGERVEPASVPTPEPLLEATGWTLTAEGTIELVANPDKTAAENLAPFQCNPLSSS